jgi:Putative addiction module component
MNIALPLDQMTIGDKIRTMEYLWDDLCQHADQVQSPAWHSDVLAERERNILVGEASFEDWNTAKKKIRESLPWKSAYLMPLLKT